MGFHTRQHFRTSPLAQLTKVVFIHKHLTLPVAAAAAAGESNGSRACTAAQPNHPTCLTSFEASAEAVKVARGVAGVPASALGHVPDFHVLDCLGLDGEQGLISALLQGELLAVGFVQTQDGDFKRVLEGV
jgi:hypothetical protein